MARLRQIRLRYAALGEAAAYGFAAAWVRLPSVARPEWRPPCDVVETRSEWIVKAELAGLDEGALEVLLYDDGLVVEGVRPWGAPGGTDVRVHAAEIAHGAFRLAVPLPGEVDRDGAAVAYDRGMLTVRLPKARPA